MIYNNVCFCLLAKEKLMKKKILFVTLLSLVGALSSCVNKDDSKGVSSEISSSISSSESSSVSSSSSSSWTDKQKLLMKTYCGSALPYPEGLFTGKVTFQQQYDSSSKQNCLVIFDESTSFTLKDYYKLLEENGWTTISSYNGNKVQTQSNTQYVELTKNSDDGKTGYEMMYYFVSGEDYSYNCLVCYNYFSSSSREDKAWSEDDGTVIDYVTTTALPYIALGEKYTITSVSENQLYMYDYYTKDLSKEYADVLTKNGYVLDEKTSKENDAYFLSKTFDNGITIDILIRYFNGNNVYVYFTPKIDEYSSWPSEITKPIEESCKVSIPEFSVKKGGKYKAYEKHGVHYVYTEDYDEKFDYYSYIEDTRSELFCWEETLSFSSYILRDDDDNNTGFMIYFQETKPTRTFTSSWPENGISKGLEDSLDVTNVEIPNLDIPSFSLTKDIKYEVKTQKDYDACYNYYLAILSVQYSGTYSEETIASLAKDYADSQIIIGVTLLAYDSKQENQTDYVTRYKVNEAYKDALYNAGWYKVPESWGDIYEDPTGQVKATIINTPSSEVGLTKITFSKGSGEAHTPTFKFSKDNYEMGEGLRLTLTLEKNMIPYEINYSSSDTSGNINVDANGVVTTSANVKDGDSATITASYVDKDGVTHSTSCIIKIVGKWTYKKSIDKVQELLTNKGYSGFTREDLISPGKKVIGEKLTVDLGNSITKEDAKSMIKNDLVPSEFTSSLWEKVTNDDDEDDALIPNIGKNSLTRAMSFNPNKTLFSKSNPSDLEKLYCYYRTDYSYFTLSYFVYTAENGNIILYVEASKI